MEEAALVVDEDLAQQCSAKKAIQLILTSCFTILLVKSSIQVQHVLAILVIWHPKPSRLLLAFRAAV